jgi:hypothetical protein
MKRFMAVLGVASVFVISGLIVAADDAADKAAPKRDANAFQAVEEKVPSDISKQLMQARPKKVVLASNGSSFDLWKDGTQDGVMHLLFGERVIVYPIRYLWSYTGDIHLYQENSPEAWLWYFYPDGRIYYFKPTSSGTRQFDTKAKFYPRLP